MKVRVEISSFSSLNLSLVGASYYELQNHSDDLENNLKDYSNHQRIFLGL